MKTFRYYFLMLFLLANFQSKAQNNNVTFNKVLQAYFNVEKALVNNNNPSANKSATALVEAIKQINTAQLDAGQKLAWTKSNEKLRYNAQHISESKSIDHQREHFASLSDEMYLVLKSFKTHPVVYREYCPMKKQYWLNPTAAIQNPYYGKQMLDCGKVTETIEGNAAVVLIK